jgi:hypothetical protein
VCTLRLLRLRSLGTCVVSHAAATSRSRGSQRGSLAAHACAPPTEAAEHASASPSLSLAPLLLLAPAAAAGASSARRTRAPPAGRRWTCGRRLGTAPGRPPTCRGGHGGGRGGAALEQCCGAQRVCVCVCVWGGGGAGGPGRARAPARAAGSALHQLLSLE